MTSASFLFHTGSIKRQMRDKTFELEDMFLFHTGSIKSAFGLQHNRDNKSLSFYSILVRLKAVRFCSLKTWHSQKSFYSILVRLKVTARTDIAQRFQSSFYSILVRLKGYTLQFRCRCWRCLFLFHTGSIKSQSTCVIRYPKEMFLFHTGSIKRI